jgi:predicted Rossmann fold nucleotide-binding protein DprA/Smf involved in DNA uptake
MSLQFMIQQMTADSARVAECFRTIDAQRQAFRKGPPTMLSIAIDQITRPSFYGQQVGQAKGGNARRAAENEVKRQSLMEVIGNIDGPVSYDYLSEKTGIAIPSISKLLMPLHNSGKIRRIASGSAKVLMERLR